MEEHLPVLLNEVIQYFHPQKNENFIDCTLGGGGHAQAILEKTAPQGKLLGLDLDEEAIVRAKKRLEKFQDRIIFINDNYKNLKKIVYDHGFSKVRGVLLDLGFSTYQIHDQDRGFSFLKEAPLDMRFSRKGELTAREIINYYTQEDLYRIFRDYGEERHSRSIAENICLKRKISPFKTTLELVRAIEEAARVRHRKRGIHFATRIFQALRLEVNAELDNLKKVLPQTLEVLEPGGRLAVISFHSLEDRIVKQFTREKAKQGYLKLINKKVIKPTQEEIRDNPKARSAKLRVVEKT